MGSNSTSSNAWHCIQVRLMGLDSQWRRGSVCTFNICWLDEKPIHKCTVKPRVEKYIFKYEPLYVARAETPQFDERFIGFGMTRNTQVTKCLWNYQSVKLSLFQFLLAVCSVHPLTCQVYEMYVAGFKFHLLNNAFTSHWGFQVTVSP